jgi:hypothetical protein
MNIGPENDSSPVSVIWRETFGIEEDGDRSHVNDPEGNPKRVAGG